MHRVVILAYDGVQSLDVCGPAEVFNGANLALDARDGTIRRGSDGWRYEVTVASIGGGTIATETPIALAPSRPMRCTRSSTRWSCPAG